MSESNERPCRGCRKSPAREGRVNCQSCADKHSESAVRSKANLRSIWKARGLCSDCGRTREDESFKRCYRCRSTTRSIGRRNFKKKETLGVCRVCGKSLGDSKYKNCETCLLKMRGRDRKKYIKRFDNRKCRGCGGPKDSNRATCMLCRIRGKRAREEKKRVAHETRTCWRCKQPASIFGKMPLCMDCWFKTIASVNTKDTSNWTSLKQLWIEQDGCCSYSGEKMIPGKAGLNFITGKNATLDHKTPSRRGGGNEKSNLQWVTWQMNTMKSNMTHEEFVAFCGMIYNKFKPT